jgi:DinB family
MRASEFLLPEYDLEMSYTRKHLERVPMDRLDFKPHDRSMSLGWLATFMAILPTWGTDALTRDSVDVTDPGVAPQQSIVHSREALLAMFDANVAAARAAVAGASDEQLRKPWSLLAAGQVIFTQPRFLVFRTYFLNHMIHHRGQLGVCLRLTGVPVPAIYSDSADERGGMFRDGEERP